MPVDEYGQRSDAEQSFPYTPADTYAERPTEIRSAPGVYRSGETYRAPAPPTDIERPAGPAEAQAAAGATELSHSALVRLRARLVRKYH